MKSQMKFQKYICLVMLIVGALAVVYSLIYCTGSWAELSMYRNNDKSSEWKAAADKYDASLFNEVQMINNILLIIGIVMILLAVVLYITACQKRRNYYVSNYVATGLCAGGNIVLSLVALILNAIWRSNFLNVDFVAWKEWDMMWEVLMGDAAESHYSESTAIFDLGFAVYAIVIVASILLILNMVWKILLMKGEKKLLSGSQLAGGEAV